MLRPRRIIHDMRDARCCIRPDRAVGNDVNDIKASEQQPGQQHGREQFSNAHVSNSRQDNHQHRWRNDRAKRTAGANRSRNQSFVVAMTQHDRHRQHTDNGFCCAHHATRHGKQDAHHDRADGNPAG